MPHEEMKALVKELILSRDVAAARQHPGLAKEIPMLQMLATAFSDVALEVPLQFCDGDWIATQAVYHQTHTGTFRGIPATNKRIKTELMNANNLKPAQTVSPSDTVDTSAPPSDFSINQCPIAILQRLFNRRAATGRADCFAVGLTVAFARHGTPVRHISPLRRNPIVLGGAVIGL